MVHSRETRASASEIKFVIGPALAPAVRRWARAHLLADPHGTGPFADEYQTASLYFDTRDYDVFQRRGSYARAKYRIRRYGASELVFLERKLRKPGILIKRRTVGSIEELAMLELAEAPAGWEGEWFHRRLRLRRLQPTCQVSYHRVARILTAPEGLARLTLDSALRAAPVHTAQFTGRGLGLLEDRLILELKFRRHPPAVFRRLIEEFALEPSPASKYRLAMTALGHLPDTAATDLPRVSLV